MSEQLALGSPAEGIDAAAAHKAERKRLAADSFRTLFSRLHKPGIDLPLIPALEPAPAEMTDIETQPVFEMADDLQPPQDQMAVTIAEEPASDPVLEGSFEDNFTYVPETGRQEELQDPAAAQEAAMKEMAERALQLELENIWRLLLAKPTADDRAQYLREAAEIHEGDDVWGALAPEHDLSRVAGSRDGFDAAGVALLAEIEMPASVDADQLARFLIDLMAAGGGSGQPQERALAVNTLLRLLPRLEVVSIEKIARRLNMMDNPPYLLVARLIRDPRLEVSSPLLEDCALVSDKDLEAVIKEGHSDRLRLIARRRKLSPAVCEALIQSGDISAVLTLVRNAAAQISHDGFLSLLVLCGNNPELLAPLATRADLGSAMAFELFWQAPPQLRRFILSRHLTDSEVLSRILRITAAANIEPHHTTDPMSQHELLEALERATRGHVEIAIKELARILRLSPATVARIIGDLSGEALVIMLKAAGYPRSAVTGLLTRMQAADMPMIARDRDVNELQIMFETLSFNKAQVLLTYWDWAQGKLGPYMPLN
jgi:uncharacterized protein (DUF2336 family)